MTAELPTVLALACQLSVWMLLTSLVLTLLRLARGPSLADRVVALDLVAFEVVGLIAVDAIQSAHPIWLRPAMVVALLGFLATVAFAHYLERKTLE